MKKLLITILLALCTAVSYAQRDPAPSGGTSANFSGYVRVVGGDTIRSAYQPGFGWMDIAGRSWVTRSSVVKGNATSVNYAVFFNGSGQLVLVPAFTTDSGTYFAFSKPLYYNAAKTYSTGNPSVVLEPGNKLGLDTTAFASLYHPNIFNNTNQFNHRTTFNGAVLFTATPLIGSPNSDHFVLENDTVKRDTAKRYTQWQIDSAINAHAGGIPTNGITHTALDSIGLGGALTQDVVISTLNGVYGLELGQFGVDPNVLYLKNHIAMLKSIDPATGAYSYFYSDFFGWENHYTDPDGNIESVRYDTSTPTGGIEVRDDKYNIGEYNYTHHTVVGGTQLAEIQDIAGVVDTGSYIKRTAGIIHLSDSTKFATYSGLAKTVFLRDSIIGGGTPFIKLPKGSNVANGGTVFASNAVDSLWYRQYDKTKGINVQWFGVKGDGTTLNNARLQAAFNMAGNINIPDGNYLVDASRNAVNIKSNTHLVLNKNAVIKTQANNNPYTYQTLYVNQAQNVSIEGGAVEGDKYTHTDTTGQHGFGISVYGSKNVSIKDMKLSKCWGDGLYIGADTVTLLLADTNIMVSNVTSTDNRRNGLSVTYVRGLRLNNCYFTNQGGGPATPSGIDIEPNSAQIVDNVKISDCSETGNLGSAITSFVNYTNAQVKNITIENNSASTNGLFGLYLYSTYSGLMRDININGYITSSQTQYGAYIRNTKNVNISNMKISGLTSPIADFRIQTDSLLKIDHLSVTDTSTLTPGVYFVGGNFNCSILNSNIATVSDAVLSTNSTTDYDSEFLNNTISSTNAAGIKLFKQDALKINNCTVRNTGKEGINLTTLTNSVVSGNILSDNGAATNNTYSAIAINGTSTNNTISANTSYQGTLNANKISYNLSLASGAGTNLVSNNNFTAGVTGTISNSGTGNTIVNPLTYTSTASQTYSSTIGWTGTTAPSGTTNHSYSWTQVGNMVTVRINLSYSVAGTALTAVTMVLPSDVPKPYQPPGFSSANNVVVYGAGDFSTSASAVGGSTNRVWLLANGTNTGFIAEILSSSSSAANAWVTFTYLTN